MKKSLKIMNEHFCCHCEAKEKKILHNTVQRNFFTHSDPRKVRFNAKVLSLPYLTVYVSKVFIDTFHLSHYCKYIRTTEHYSAIVVGSPSAVFPYFPLTGSTFHTYLNFPPS
jgi:hypothetical protein